MSSKRFDDYSQERKRKLDDWKEELDQSDLDDEDLAKENGALAFQENMLEAGWIVWERLRMATAIAQDLVEEIHSDVSLSGIYAMLVEEENADNPFTDMEETETDDCENLDEECMSDEDMENIFEPLMGLDEDTCDRVAGSIEGVIAYVDRRLEDLKPSK